MLRAGEESAMDEEQRYQRACKRAEVLKGFCVHATAFVMVVEQEQTLREGACDG